MLTFFLGAVVITALRPLTRYIPPLPEKTGEMAPWTLISQNAESFESKSLAGKTFILGFFFTECKTICPLIVQSLKTLDVRFKRNDLSIPLVLISVDPGTDTPAVLSNFMAKQSLDVKTWTLLTGSKEALYNVAESNFKVAMGNESKKILDGDILHFRKLILVDGNYGIRGYYEPNLAGMDELFHRAERVSAEIKFSGSEKTM